MMWKLIVPVLFAILETKTCLAQPEGSQALTNCADALQCGQLSISLTSNIVTTRSTMFLREKVTNRSIEVIALSLSPSPKYFLTDSSGKTFQLKAASVPNATIISNKKSIFRLNPGESHEWSMPLDINKDIKPADYEMRVARSILVIAPNDYQLFHTTNAVPPSKRLLKSSDGKTYELLSNPLKVKVVR